MTTRRIQRKQRKRKKLKIILFVCIAFILSLSAYSVYEYRSGVAGALSDNEKDSNKTNNTEETNDFNGVKEEAGKTNVLILGVDSRGEEQARTDTIMVAQYDPSNESVKLVSIMRDTYVSIPGYKDNKINTAFYFGGTELLRQTIKENFGIDVQYYAIVDFNGFTKVVDTIAPKGIEMDVAKRMVYQDGAGTININLHPGLQQLSGKELLDYARFRHDREGDFGRVRRQQEVISKVKDEFLSLNGIIKIPRLIGTLQPFVKTNISQAKMLALGTEYIVNPGETIETLRIPVEGTFWDKSYSHAGAVLEMDVDKNKQAIQEFFNINGSVSTQE